MVPVADGQQQHIFDSHFGLRADCIVNDVDVDDSQRSRVLNRLGDQSIEF